MRAAHLFTVAGLAALVATSGVRAASQSDGLFALILAAGSFVTDQCPGLGIDESLSTSTLRSAGMKGDAASSPAVKAEVASWLTEWRGDPKAACSGLLTNFGPDGRTVRNLIYRTKRGA